MESINLDAVILLLMGIWIGYFIRGRMSGRIEERDIYYDEEIEMLIARLDTQGRENVENALRRHRKIEAIKHFRAVTGAGLKESKDAVEKMMRDENMLS